MDVGEAEDVSDVCDGSRTVVSPSRTVVNPPNPRGSDDLDVAVAVPVAEVEDESSSPPLWVFVVSAGRTRAPPNLQAQHCAYLSVLLSEGVAYNSRSPRPCLCTI